MTLWYAITWLAAASARPTALQRLDAKRRVALRIGLAAVCAFSAAMIAAGWSFRSDALDMLAPGLLLLLVALLIHSLLGALGWGTTALWQSAVYAVWLAVLAAVWAVTWFGASFTFPPAAEGRAPDGYAATVRVEEMAWSSDYVASYVSRRPTWAPGLERRISTSRVRGPDAGLVTDESLLAVTPTQGGREFEVTYGDDVLDRVRY